MNVSQEALMGVLGAVGGFAGFIIKSLLKGQENRSRNLNALTNERIDDLEKQVLSLSSQVLELTAENAELKVENRFLTAKVHELEEKYGATN